MRRTVLLATLAMAVVTSGCSGLVGQSDRTPTATVTPAPVPTAGSPRAAATGSEGCLVPPPATPDRTPAPTPATPRALPVKNGSVDGSDLVEIHDRVLPRYSYHLRVDRVIEVRTLAGARAFTYTGVFGGIPYVRAYGVGGTLYMLDPGADDVRVRKRSYDPGSLEDDRFLPSLSARDWLDDRIGVYEYDRVGTRTWNGTRVRVFRRTFDDARQVVRRKVVALNSTIYVDDRGIIRLADHDTKFREIEHPEDEPRWRNATLVVTDVGSTRVSRPAAFCGLGPDPIEPTGIAVER